MSKDGTQKPDSRQAQQDAAKMMQEWSDIAHRSHALVHEFVDRQIESVAGTEFELIDYSGLAEAFASFNQKLLEHPERLIEAQAELMQQSMTLWQTMMNRMLGQPTQPFIEPDPGDRRFRDASWNDELVFDYIKQSYLLVSRWVRDTVTRIDDLDPDTQQKVDFFTRQFLSATSPSNFALTNPEVLRRAEATEGESLLSGLKHLLGDLERGHGRLKISMTRESAFEVGVNVATSPGKVIFENALMQLIQYAPTTEQVHQIPFLIVPPWINKFYILDLQPRNSLIAWLVSQGHTVFVISWVNPDASHKDMGFADYMKLGPLAAMDAIWHAIGEEQVNVLGFCIGGILMSTTLACLAARGDERINSLTLLASMIDFRDVGEVSVFVNDEQLARIEDHVAEHGYLDGRHMADMFSMMRENDLIWSFVVNNYLLGREPMPFDLLYWNSDSTRLPARMLVEYLRQFYIANGLVSPGSIEIEGVPIELGQVTTPIYAVATKDDHIAPWHSCFPARKHFGGPVRFVLGGSGHIAGIVNPPSRKKYGYWTGDEGDDPESWLAAAEHHEGSWWSDWGEWLERRAGPMVDARQPGDGGVMVIEDAPGRYVKVKSVAD